MTRHENITSDVPATREHELAVMVERILDGQLDCLPKVDAQFYCPIQWIDAAQAHKDAAGEPEDLAAENRNLEAMLFNHNAYEGWLNLSDSEQAAYAYDPLNYFDARREARKFRTMEAGNYRIAQFCADIMGGARV